MRELCRLGAQVPNILVEQGQVFKQTFSLSSEWSSLAASLMLPDEDHLYMLWLWMETVNGEYYKDQRVAP